MIEFECDREVNDSCVTIFRNENNQSKLESLAGMILKSCGIPFNEKSEVGFTSLNDKEFTNNDENIVALERAIGIVNVCPQPLISVEKSGVINKDADVFYSFLRQTTKKYIRTLDTTDSSQLSFVKKEEKYEYPSLEDHAPFSSVFYRLFAQFLVYAYDTTLPLFKGKKNQKFLTQKKITNRNNSLKENYDKSPYNDLLKKYHIFKDKISFRITKLLIMLMELNIFGNSQKSNFYAYNYGKNKHVSFLYMILYYAEGNEGTEYELKNIPLENNNDVHDKNRRKKRQYKVIPVIQCFFSYLSFLPELEAYVLYLKRHFEYFISLKNSFMSSNKNDNTHPSASDKTDHKTGFISTSRIFCERLDREWMEHVSMLERIAGNIYVQSSPRLRAKCRISLGDVLHNFIVRAGCNDTIPVDKFTSFSMIGYSASTERDAIGIANMCASGVDSLLRLLLRILVGIGKISTKKCKPGHEQDTLDNKERNCNEETISTNGILHDSHRHLLFNILLPLHKPSNMVLWRDQTPVLGVYHKPLVQCICTIISKEKTLIGCVVSYLINPDIWPEGSKSLRGAKIANTPKLVLLLHEIDTYFSILDLSTCSSCLSSSVHRILPEQEQPSLWKEVDEQVHSLSKIIEPLISKLAACIESDNSRIVERALVFFRNKNFQFIIRYNLSTVITPLIKALCRIDSGMDIPWNPTVRKMTLLVLSELKEYSRDKFSEYCEGLFSHLEKCHNKVNVDNDNVITTRVANINFQNQNTFTGIWKPSKGNNVQRHGKNSHNYFTICPIRTMSPTFPKPPRILKLKNIGKKIYFKDTGDATRTMDNNNTVRKIQSVCKNEEQTRKSELFQQISLSHKNNEVISSIYNFPCTLYSKNRKEISDNNLGSTKKVNNVMCQTSISLGLEKVYRFMDKLKPQVFSSDRNEANEISRRVREGMTECPVLIHDLKFHDLIFGHTLGTGAFSTVKYTRQIARNKTRSSWPEYAVKIVSTKKIEEFGYERSINREIAILQILTHPGIARLISSFHFQNGVYLVLEYASRGDLYTLLMKNGLLDEKSARFVVGEVVAALWSIHQKGFLYGDLKPENILITKSGHIKLTDFGGCRPLSSDAKNFINIASNNLLKSLRNGDWRESIHSGINQENVIRSCDEDLMIGVLGNDSDDMKIEGTTAYLPPEVVLGDFPSLATDSWAFGCLLFQCLSGRPPILEENDFLTRQKIVSFSLSNDNGNRESHDIFQFVSDNVSFSMEAKTLIKQCLNLNTKNRPNMVAVSEDSFFQGTNVFTLHMKDAYPLEISENLSNMDMKWRRRQFSSIWSPHPQTYLCESNDPTKRVEENDLISRSETIPEGEEANTYFFNLHRKEILSRVDEV